MPFAASSNISIISLAAWSSYAGDLLTFAMAACVPLLHSLLLLASEQSW